MNAIVFEPQSVDEGDKIYSFVNAPSDEFDGVRYPWINYRDMQVTFPGDVPSHNPTDYMVSITTLDVMPKEWWSGINTGGYREANQHCAMWWLGVQDVECYWPPACYWKSLVCETKAV